MSLLDKNTTKKEQINKNNTTKLDIDKNRGDIRGKYFKIAPSM